MGQRACSSEERHKQAKTFSEMCVMYIFSSFVVCVEVRIDKSDIPMRARGAAC